MDHWSSPAPSAGPSLWQPSRPLSWKGANKSGPAWTSQPMNHWSLPAPSGGIPELLPPMQLSCSVANPHSSKCANAAKSVQASTSALAQQPNLWSLPASSAGFPSSSSSGTSENERSTSTRSADSGYESRPGSIPLELQSTSSKESTSVKLLCQSVPSLSKEEELTKALLYMFNLHNYTLGKVHTNFTLESGEIVSLLGGGVDREEYLQEIKGYIIQVYCGTEERAKKIYDLKQFPFIFSDDLNYEEDERITVLTRNTHDAVLNLKVHLIQVFRMTVEGEVAEKLVKEMKFTNEEASECIRRSVYLGAKNNNPKKWYVFFDGKHFQRGPKLFEKLQEIYVETFKSRWEKCGLDDSLVYDNGSVLYIENAIDINVVKKIEEYEKKEYEERQASHPFEETSVVCVPNEEAMGENPIAFDKKNFLHFLDHDFGSDCESMDCENTGKGSLKRRSQSPEDEGSSARKSSRSGSNNSSSEEAGGLPRSNFSDSELCMEFRGANLGSK